MNRQEKGSGSGIGIRLDLMGWQGNSALIRIFTASVVAFTILFWVDGMDDVCTKCLADEAADRRKAQNAVHVVTYNVQFLPGIAEIANRRPQAQYRADRIGESLANYDVVGINEVFHARHRKRLLKYLNDMQTLQPPEKMKSAFGIDSGLVFASRLQIVKHNYMTFDNDSSPIDRGLLADGFARKGVLHARIEQALENGKRFIDVFVTHLESRESEIRLMQFKLLARFVKRCADPNTPILLMGDLNCNGNPLTRCDSTSQYNKLMKELNGIRPNTKFRDLWAAAHPNRIGGTNHDGSERIDYLILSNPPDAPRLAARVVKVRTFADNRVGRLSDHSAVEALLEWTNEVRGNASK